MFSQSPYHRSVTTEQSPAADISQAELDALLAVATLYISAFHEDEMLTLPEKLQLQYVEQIVERHGRRY